MDFRKNLNISLDIRPKTTFSDQVSFSYVFQKYTYNSFFGDSHSLLIDLSYMCFSLWFISRLQMQTRRVSSQVGKVTTSQDLFSSLVALLLLSSINY